MPIKETLYGDMSWAVDPSTLTDLDEIIEGYEKNEPSPIPKGYEEYNIDFENDPDYSLLLEYVDDIVDPYGNLITDKKVVKNWKYFSKPQETMNFYRQKAKYIMATYNYYKKEFEDYKNGRSKREMSMEMFREVHGNVRFFEYCMEHELQEFILIIHHMVFNRESVRKMAEVMDIDKGSSENEQKLLVNKFARLLVAKDRYRFEGKKIFDKAISRDETLKEIVLDEQIELVGMLAMKLGEKLKELNGESTKRKRKKK